MPRKRKEKVPENDGLKHFSRVISREEWGALPPQEVGGPDERPGTVEPPIDKIFYNFHRNYAQCFSQEQCSDTLRYLQLREMNERGLMDVRHNFMISNDLNVYEGRGWYTKPVPATTMMDLWDHKAIDIGFFSEDAEEVWPFEEMFRIAYEFIEDAIKKGLIVKDYQLI